MQRLTCTPRPDWQKRVEQQGLVFHTSDTGRPYWDESAYYVFSSAEIDTLEQATYALDKLCLQAVEELLRQERFDEFQIPPEFIPWIKRSWEADEQSIYGRFDLLFDGSAPPKLIEYNADTPTALLEAAVVQWFWLKDVAPEADQFNSLHERLLEAWRQFHKMRPQPVAFASVAGHVEDYVTVNYLRDVAVQAGVPSQYLTMQQVGWNARRRAFVDMQERELACVFKLYPWEWMFREQFGPHLAQARTRWLEAPWKVLLSNKALLPLLWELFPGHPNLLEASWRPLAGRQVRKPTRGREGANVAILDGGSIVAETLGPYGSEPCIYQAFHPTPRFDGRSAVMGCWLVSGYACGLGIRQDEQAITTNTSRFVPHLFRR
jgi:glutathionylspermidine synthase